MGYQLVPRNSSSFLLAQFTPGGIQELIVENYNALSNKTLSPIKRSLQLNALEIYGIVVQRWRFIRAGTLY